MTDKEFREMVELRDQTISRLESKLKKLIGEKQSGMFRKLQDDFLSKLDRDEFGKIKATQKNAMAMLNIEKSFEALAKETNENLAKNVVSGVISILNFNQNYFAKMDGDAKVLPLMPKVESFVKQWIGIEDNKSVKNGFIDQLVSDDPAKVAVKNLAMKIVVGQVGFEDAKEQLSLLINGNKDKLGVFEKHHKTFANDLYSQIDRATSNVIRENLKYEFAVYEGGLIETSRPFCEDHNGKVYHITEILKFNPVVGIPNPYNPITDLGGYNCRHHLNWIANAMAKAMGKDIDKFIDKKPEKPEVKPEQPTKPKEPKAKPEAKKITENELNAVEDYISGDGMWINRWLRNKTFDLAEEEKSFLENLDSATDNKINYDKFLFRSVDASSIFENISDMDFDSLKGVLVYGSEQKYDKQISDSLISKVMAKKSFIENGFMSVTKDENIAADWGGFTGSSKPIILKIKTNEDTRGFDTGKHKMEQEEIILKRGQKYDIEKIYTKDGEIYIDVILKNSDTKAKKEKDSK